MRANTMSLGKRVLSRAALLAPATVLCLASATSMAAVIDSGPLNINVVPNIDGLYVNFVTGANANGTIAGWDFNPYQTGTFLTFFTSAAAANTNSVVGAAGNPGQANYAAAKAGVAGMTRALARELGSRNITVNCVAPGFIATDMTEGLAEVQKAALMQQIPLGRLGTPEEIAATVAFLASAEAGYITGAELHVNGGMFMN